MSNEDEDVSVPRFKDDPTTPLTVLLRLIPLQNDPSCDRRRQCLVSEVASLSQPNEEEEQMSLLSLPTLGFYDSNADTETYTEEMMKLLSLAGDDFDSQRFSDLVALLRESLFWKECIHLFYTVNSFFLRHLMKERICRLQAAVDNGDVFNLHLNSVDVLISQVPPVLAVEHKDEDIPGLSYVRTTENFWYTKIAALPLLMDEELEVDKTKQRALAEMMYVASTTSKMFERFNRPHVLETGKLREVVDGASTHSAPEESNPRSCNLYGVACSGGTASGPACIMDSLSQSGRMKQGDVLITRYTNPSWTPLFSLAVAVVVEDGGILSHSAVVARECNVPCVSQVKSAMSAIQPGQRVTVDGNTGVVTLHSL